ncbi:hypothetical protein LguiB_000096 [Lonicera macranthoides]
MGQFWVILFFKFAFLSCLISISASNIEGQITTKTYIVRVQNDMKPFVYSNVEHWYSDTLRSLNSDPLGSDKSEAIQSNKNNKHHFLHVYKTVFHGFSTKLTEQQAKELKTRPGVLSVFPDNIRQLHTTRTPQFLGLAASNPTGILNEADSGSNVIIGIFDTGIWPERRSFHDEGLEPIPSHWKGECTEGENFTKSHCNKKIIGARYFTEGYEASVGGINDTNVVRSARDTDGHGTHTASTAAGRLVANASLFGFANGAAVGVAPKARIAAYKICWKRGCMDSDILAAFDKAVEDGVDVISISVGGGAVPYNLDPISIGAFGAMEKGVIVSASAGNDGPTVGTVTNVAPWITTVGASTIDRNFPADLILGDGRVITGASLYSGEMLPEKTYLPLIYGGNASTESRTSAWCMEDSLDKELVRGKIVMCERGTIPRVAKGEAVKKAGGVGVIIANVAPIGEGLVADPHLIPALAVTESAGHAILDYVTCLKDPKAYMVFRGTEVGVKPAPVVASFSSRGPNAESIYVLKPDIIAPGVNILAAWPEGVAPTETSSDTRITEFNIASGTSMSCPHVSGLVALLKGSHPDWSPAMIRSALMTTAYVLDHNGKPLLDEKSYNISTTWDMGAGHVDPERAVNPGLVYDLTPNDYLNFLCASNYSSEDMRSIARRSVLCNARRHNPWDLNYPAISVAFNDVSGPSNMVVVRTVTHVSDGPSTYIVNITNPKGVIVTVNPPQIKFRGRGQKQRYVVRILAEKVAVSPGNVVTEFGKLTWTNERHKVASPLAVTWQKSF